MKTPISFVCASALAATLMVGEAQSAPMSFVAMPVKVVGNSDVINVRDNMRWPRGGVGHWGGGARSWNGNRAHWNGNRAHWGNRGYWRGHRHGWHGGGWNGHYDDGWYGNGFYLGGGGAFLLGALIGTAIANSNYRNNYYVGSSHAHWCANRYRSYSPRSDTFQPYNGPRRRCVSPY